MDSVDPSLGYLQCASASSSWEGYFQSCKLFTELNMRRFIVYNVLHGVTGFGATSSLLGFRFKIAVGGPMLHFLTPGTICSPLLPFVASLFSCGVPGRRSIVTVVAYAAYVATLVRALQQPEAMTTETLYPVYAMMAATLVLDLSIFQAGRGEQYCYMVVCLMFDDWISGCQIVQLGLWIWAGVSKCGPWFPPVFPFLTKDSLHCLLMPKQFHAKMFCKDFPADMNPSNFSTFVAVCGSSLEIIFPVSCCMANPSVAMFGTIGMCLYHCFIINTLPFASVFEWNYFCIIMAIFLFYPGVHTFAFPHSHGLIAFLSVVSFAVPLLGNIAPNIVPFLVSYRPYMGNWRFAFYVCHKKAADKHKKLKSWENPWTEENGKWFYGLLGGIGKQGFEAMEQWNYILGASLMYVPGYRAFVPIMEKLCEDNGWDINDVLWSHSEPYQNQIFGWSLGTGWIAARECVRQAYNEICNFDEKEMYFIQFEPCSTFACGNYGVQYRCFDVTKGPTDAQYHGKVPYKELSEGQPMEFQLKPDQIQCGGNSIKGTFLGTYY